MRKIIGLGLLGLFLSPVFVLAASAPKLYVQWAQSTPGDWTLLTTSTWDNQPTKLDPVGDTTSLTGIGDSLLNSQKGWIFSINVQGVTFNYYDHYQVTGTSTTVTVIAWRDDPLLFPVGTRMADVAVINSLKFDAKVGQDNTDQLFTWYREGAQYDNLFASGVPENVTLKSYSEFVPPVTGVKPGIYVSDSKFQDFLNAETEKGWR